MSTTPTACMYHLANPPLPVEWIVPTPNPPTPTPGKLLWIGHSRPPRIGERVNVRLNSYGLGTVRGYFIEHGFLGLHVDLEKAITIPAHRAGCWDALIFGIDLFKSDDDARGGAL